MFYLLWHDAVIGGLFLKFPEKSDWLRIWTTLFGPCPDDPMTDLSVDIQCPSPLNLRRGIDFRRKQERNQHLF